MGLKGELKCYHCGYVSGLAAGDAERPFREWRLRLAPVCDPAKVWKGGRVHCCLCGGPIYMDEAEFLGTTPEETTPTS